jgi:hypothetical protein
MNIFHPCFISFMSVVTTIKAGTTSFHAKTPRTAFCYRCFDQTSFLIVGPGNQNGYIILRVGNLADEKLQRGIPYEVSRDRRS